MMIETMETKLSQKNPHIFLEKKALREKLKALSAYRGIERIWRVLPSARLVGGCVRDLLLGYEIHDIDLAVPIPPQEIIDILEKEKIRVVPTGFEHGTVTAIIEGCPYEITTLRCDLQTDGRHAQVTWTDDWREDAARRDFTMNALSLDKEGILYDYFSGIEDLHNNIVRFVGNAEKRIEEDALRILRFFRFSARYSDWSKDNPLEKTAYDAIRNKKSLISLLSSERIASEILKILSGPQVIAILSFMEEAGILEEIFSFGTTLERLKNLIHAGHVISAVDGQQDSKGEYFIETGIILRLYALCSSLEVGKRLKLSNVIRAHLSALEAQLPHPEIDISDDAMRRLLVCYRRAVLRDKSWLVQIETANFIKESQETYKHDWALWRKKMDSMERPIFPLVGKDVLSLGVAPGAEIGRLLKRVQGWWMCEGCMPDYRACMDFLHHIIKESE